MQKLFAINFPDDKTKFDWLKRFVADAKDEQQCMVQDAAERWPMLNGVATGKETVQ